MKEEEKGVENFKSNSMIGKKGVDRDG